MIFFDLVLTHVRKQDIMETQEISMVDLKYLLYSLQVDFKNYRETSRQLIQIKVRISDCILSDWVYPGFTLGGAGRIEWNKAFTTYIGIDGKPGDMFEFSKIKEIQLSADYLFKPIGAKRVKLNNDISYIIKIFI